MADADKTDGHGYLRNLDAFLKGRRAGRGPARLPLSVAGECGDVNFASRVIAGESAAGGATGAVFQPLTPPFPKGKGPGDEVPLHFSSPSVINRDV